MADPVRLITNGTAGIGLNSSGDFSRDNIRKFTVTETFEKLLYNRIQGCGESAPSGNDDRLPGPNYAYPIAGEIGMYELISTFVDLNEDAALQPIPSGSGVFGDRLMFTTTLMGQVSPSVQINPVGHKWGLASPTNFAATATRTDKHNLNIRLVDVERQNQADGRRSQFPRCDEYDIGPAQDLRHDPDRTACARRGDAAAMEIRSSTALGRLCFLPNDGLDSSENSASASGGGCAWRSGAPRPPEFRAFSGICPDPTGLRKAHRLAGHRWVALLNDALLRWPFPDRFRAHSSVGRAADS